MYQIVLLGGDDSWRTEVRAAIVAATAEIIGHHNQLAFFDHVADAVAGDDLSTVVMLLAEPATAADPIITAELLASAAQAYPIVPTHRAPTTATDSVPAVISQLNVAEWHAQANLVVAAVLDAVGIAERHRRLFISYRQKDAIPVADQLHESLSHQGFDVFVDRFRVPIGHDFQRRVDSELADKAFVLVIESPDFNNSRWTRHEVTYALAHGLAIVALRLPGTPDHALCPMIDRAFRHDIDAADLTAAGILTDAALERVLALIWLEHSRQLRRRRNQMLGSLQDYLAENNCEMTALDQWTLLAQADGKQPEMFTVCPTNPSVAEYYLLDMHRDRIAPTLAHNPRATVVHDSDDLDPDATQILEWVGSARDLTAVLLRSRPGVLVDLP